MKQLARPALYAILCLCLVACANALRWRQYDYVVQHGDTLYSIAWHFNLDYRDLAGWNGIRSPYRIFPGEKLMLHPSSGYRAHAPKPATPRRQSSRHVARSKKPPPATSRPTARPHVDKNAKVARWLWPATGKIVRRFQAGKLNAKGINIGGQLGEAVRATATGRVVYSGSGLRGYGELIIIKHNDHYLSAYAHNRKRLVREGDKVKAGDKIATMGRGNNGKALLHFEIRRDGKPVDPLKYVTPQG